MAGLRFNIDADLTKFGQLVRKIQEVKKGLEGLSKSSPKYDKLYSEFKRIKSELDTLQQKFAEIQTALAQVDISKGFVDNSKKIRHETEEASETVKNYTDSLAGIKEQLKQVTNEINSMSEAEKKSLSGVSSVKKYAELKAQINVAADEMRTYVKEQENIIKVQNASDGSLTQLRRQLSLLTAQYDNLSRDLRGGATGKELLAQIQVVTKELNEAEQASMRFYRNVGNYSSGWNGLNVQVQQLARELPSLAISMNTFFLAISNNLPMLVDEIKLAKDRLAELKAEGKEGTPVWKQLAKSLLSWQTALVVGITVLSAYGSEIADWVKGLFKAKGNVDILKESLEEYNKAVLESAKNAQAEKTKLDLLYRATQNASKPLEERKNALNELQRIYPGYFSSLSKEEILAGKASDAYIKLSASIIAASNAIAARDMIVKQQQIILENEQKITDAYARRIPIEKEMERFREKEQKAPIRPYGNIGSTIERKNIQDRLDAVDKEIAGYRQAIYQANKLSKKLEGGINISDLLFNANSGKGNEKEEKHIEYLDSYQQQKAIKKSGQDIQDTITQSQLNAQKMSIGLMQDGNAKELAQINANYDAKIVEIRKRERELLQTLQDAEYQRWKQANPDYQKKGMQFTPTTTVLPQSEQGSFDAEYSAAYQQQQNSITKILSGTLAKYRDFAAQRGAIERQMNEDIAFLQSQRTEANSDEIDRAIQVAKDKAKEGIQAVKDEENKALAGQDNTFLKMLFGDVSQLGFSQLSFLITQARQLREYLSGNGSKEGITFISPEQLEAIEKSPAELDKLKKSLDKLLNTNGKEDKWSTLFDTFKKGFADLKSAKGFKEVSGAISTISGAAGQAAGELSQMFDAMGNTTAADALSSVQSVMSAVSNIGQGFASGGIVGGIMASVGEAVNLIGKAFSANQRHKAAQKEIMNEAIAQQREYNLLLMQQNLEYEKATTIFGTDTYAKAANAVEVMKDAVVALNEELKGTGKYSGGYKISFKGGIHLEDAFSEAQRELYNSFAGLADIEIKTGHKKTGLFGWGKGKDIYSSVLDVYPDLIDANGEFNQELAQTIISTREMSEEDKAAFQNMIDLAEQAEEAFNSMNDYLTDIFGELGNNMSDALVDAFKNGKDAAKTFTKSVSDMLETLAEQMVYSVTIGPLLEEAQNEMQEAMKDTSLTDDQKFKQWANILNGLVSDATEQQKIANQLYESYQQAAGEQGFDIFQPESKQQSASKGTFETVTQDQAAELSGRFTALQIAGEEIRGLNEEQLEALRQIYETLAGKSLGDATSLPSPGSPAGIVSQSQQSIQGSYSPQVNVSFPTGQLDALVSEVKTLSSGMNDLLRFGAENVMNVQTLGENSSNMVKRIPQQIQELKRTIESKL